jgi:predicted amidohydrolase
MPRPVTISAVQLPNFRGGSTSAEKRRHNLRVAEEMLDEAGRRGSDIACLGEMFNSLGCEMRADNPDEWLDDIPGELTERIGAVARRHRMHVIAAIMGRLEGVPRNAACLFGRDGRLFGGYCKVHPTESELALGIVAGDIWPVFELDFGRIGIQICHDNSFPESARCLALNGAEVIFWPHVQSGWGGEMWDITLKSRAIDNGVWHVAACFGCEENRAWRPGMMVGRSSITGPDGLIIADAGRKPGIATATVDLDQKRIAHSWSRGGESYFWQDVLRGRRPDAYDALTREHDRPETRYPEGPCPWLGP